MKLTEFEYPEQSEIDQANAANSRDLFLQDIAAMREYRHHKYAQMLAIIDDMLKMELLQRIKCQ